MVRSVGSFVGRGIIDPVEPHSDLVPLGWGDPNIYINPPDEPVDPRNCERWPDSPWCGGNPWTRNFMDLEVEMVRDECNIGVQLQATLGFTKFPQFQAVWRAPACRGQEPENQSFNSKPFTSSTPQTFPTGYSDSEKITAVIAEESRTVSDFKLFKRGVYTDDLYYEVETTATASPMFQVQTNGRPPTSGLLASVSTSGRVKEKMSEALRKRDGWPFPIDHEGFCNGNVTLSHSNSPSGYFDRYRQWSDSVLIPGYSVLRARVGTIHVVYGSFLALKLSYPTAEFYERDPSLPLNPNLNESIVGVEENWRRFRIIAIHRDPPPKPPKPPKFPPPPPPPKKRCCMSCCNSPREKQNEDLLKLILKRVNDLHKKVGETDLPASVPTNLADASKGITKIQNLAHFSAYIVKQLDAITGQYPIEIKIKDTDLTKEGNQSSTIKLPNQAEAIAEMFGICMATKIETDAILKAVLRSLVDAGSHKSTSIQTYYYVKGISEYLAYKAKQKVVKVPFAFTPGETSTDKVLKEKEVEIKIVENADEDDLKDALAPLLELAAMWKSQNFRKVDTKDAKNDILRILRQIGAVADDLGAGGSESSEEDFDAFLEKVERGWTGEAGATDTEHPYGRAYDERPRIREIGISGDQEPPPP